MNIVYLSYPQKAITGGQRYNKNFISYLQTFPDHTITKTPHLLGLYPSWKKMLAPFAELKRIKLFSTNSLIFWSDTAYYYHFLLAIISKFFKKAHSTIIIHHFQHSFKNKFTRLFSIQYLYYLLFDDLIVPSPYTYDTAKVLFPHKQVYYIPLPFEKNFIVSSQYEKGNFLYVGTIEERKGLLFLIDALGFILSTKSDFIFQLNIVGKIVDNSYYEKIIKRINEIGISSNVHFLGRISDEQLDYYYKKAEIFVFPSLLEGYGIVLVEAMNRGIPIIAFNNSAMPYSIHDHENGLLAKNMDSNSFAKNILEIHGNTSLREKLQEGMKSTILSLKSKKDFEQGINLYLNSVINENRD